MDITIKVLRDLFDCDPLTGILVWKERTEGYAKNQAYADRWNTRFSGKISGNADSGGYLFSSIFGKQIRNHRICYALYNGIDLKDVPPEIDHKYGDRKNNAEYNLRASDRLTNGKNVRMHKRNKCGLKGVCYSAPHKSWRAAIMVKGKYYDQRGFKTKEEAHAWYVDKSKLLHAEFGCGNKNGTF